MTLGTPSGSLAMPSNSKQELFLTQLGFYC